MAKIVVSYKIFPSEVTVNLALLKEKILKTLPKYASIHRFVEEPIAFGLVALIVHVVFPEEKSGGLNEVENRLKKIDEIREIETLMIRRI